MDMNHMDIRKQNLKVLFKILILLYLKLLKTLNIFKKYFKTFIFNKSNLKLKYLVSNYININHMDMNHMDIRKRNLKVLLKIMMLLYLKLFKTLNIFKKYFKTFIFNKSGLKLKYSVSNHTVQVYTDIYHMDPLNGNFRFSFKILLLSLRFFKTLNLIKTYFNTIIYNNSN